MAEDCPDGDYLGAYSRFFSEFVARVNPYDQLPVSVSSCNVTKAEIVGEIINVTLQYLNQTQCPSSLQAHLVHQVIQEIKSMCKKQPEDCGFRAQEKAYTSLKLMQAITSKVNEICTRYLDNSRLALLPPPFSTPLPEVAAGGSKNLRRKMEDRYVVLHDLHTIFGIEDDSIANYYAVFDGHAGQDVAVYCATHLHQYLAESIYYPTDPERALHDAFLTTDAHIIEKSKTQKIDGGTTAVCTLILNKKLYVAWVGDSTATLIKRDSVVQLVNPHRLNREDEVQRIRKTGGLVMPSMGIMRVNGFLSVSRAIGDVRYKPFVTGEPEIRTVLLDGTEDFLVLASDGLTDHLDPTEILTVLYHEIRRNPNEYKRAHQILLQWAKRAGSKDNITVVVVLLTPASVIAARPLYVHPYRSPQVNEKLEKMNSKDKPLFLDIDDAHNAINSNILKQTMIGHEAREDDGILAASNGKHENGDADYDYSDLGPETDVDAIDDVPPAMSVKNLSYEFFKDNDDGTNRDSNLLDNMNMDQSTNANFNANANTVHETMIDNNLRENDDDEDDDEDEDEDEDDDVREREDNDIRGDVRDEIALPRTVHDGIVENIHGIIHEEMDNRVREQLDDEEARNDEVHVDDLQDIVEKAGPVDYDDSPPSLQANKPLQHALINEADNVADSEDSEDEWNYYRVDPNKEKESTTPVNENLETRNEEEANEVSDQPIEEDNELKIQSESVQEDIKCEDSKEESLELIDTEISTVERTLEPEDKERARLEEQENLKDMDFQLNPNAAEFIPVSPQFTEPRMNLVEDYPVSGSPFKQVPQMDDIQVPSQSEFEKEVCQRPREVENDDKEYQNGSNSQRTDCIDFASERQKVTSNLDDSEISSTKAEFGDESTTSFLTATEFHRTGITVDESFSSSERDYDITKDPMAMSYTPSDFEAAFEKGVDLNAVHELSNTDLDEKNGMEKDDEDLVVECADFQPDSINTTRDVAIEETVSEVPEEPAVLVNLSSHEEDSEGIFIECADEPSEEKTVDLLNLQSESSQEQPDIARYDHSPLTENYSGEIESEKEPVSVDNEQPLSPSSIDIDETKPIDEASEDAALPVSDLQKETCTNEADTPSSLSPVPDAMEDDVVAPTNVSENLSALHADAPEFVPGHYSFQAFGSNEACQLSPKEAADVCQMSPAEPAENAFEPIKEDLAATLERDEKEIDEVCAKPMVQENLLNFAEEENVCAEPSQLHDQLTPPLSPQEIERKIIDDVVCPLESSVTRELEEKLESRETPEETNLIECKTKEIAEAMEEPEQLAEHVKPLETMEPMKERSMNLSDSMQEFTGLEKELQPKKGEILTANVIEDVKEEEVKEDVQPEKLVDLVTEEQCKIEEKIEVESLPSETKEVEPLETKEVEPLETKEVEPVETKEVEAVEIKEVEPVETKEPEVIVPEIKPEAMEPQVEEPKEETEVKENEVAEVAAAVAATAAVAAAGAAAVQSKAKPKTTPAKSTKATTTKAAAQKSNPTSPSKSVTSTTRTSTAATKKPSTTAAARPKDLDAPKKSTVSSTTASKPLTPKSSKTTTAAATAKPSSARTSLSATPKPKLVASPKPADKKPTANGDMKPISKPAAAKPAATKSLVTKTSTTTVKASTTSRPAGTTTTITTSKPRPASATTKTTTSMTTKSSSTAISSTNATPPLKSKSAPTTGTAAKTRLAAKSPIIDKQVKETANKQISMARTTAGASKTTATRLSTTSSATSTTVKRATSKTTTKTTATPQTKKSTSATSKVTKTSTVGKTTTEKAKIVQNGVSEKVEINAIIDDVPMKDLSPVVAPNDNQLIANSD